MHLCPGNLVAIGRAVVYYARAAHTFSAGIKCRHCRLYAYDFQMVFMTLGGKEQITFLTFLAYVGISIFQTAWNEFFSTTILLCRYKLFQSLPFPF